MNICVKCKHIRRNEPSSPRGECDYNITCAAFDGDTIPCLDPVLGVPGFMKTNDLGSQYFVRTADDARPTCRSKNPVGECPRFELKP